MALAQPTGLTVQELTPFATLEQEVRRENAGGVFATLEQWTGGANPGGVFATLEQRTGYLRQNPGGPFATLTQHTGNLRINDGGPFATLEQAVVFLRENAGGPFATLAQEVRRESAGGVFARLRQTVMTASQAATPERHHLVFLDGEDITGRCHLALSVTASEGDNRTATLTYYPPSGPISITAYQGREIEIHHRIDGAWRPTFTGKVDVPTYDRETRAMRLRCNDLRNERLGKEDQSRLKTLTGGLYSFVTQREEATGEQWVRELMKTVEGSLDYTGSGALRYRPWAVSTPRYDLAPGDIHHREISMEFATRSEIVNRVPISVAFRWFKRQTFQVEVGAGIETGDLCQGATCLPAPGQALPTKEAALQSAYNLSGWQVLTTSVGDPAPSGWYQLTTSAFDEKVAYVASDTFRETYATSVSATLVRYVSQGMRWTDEISVEAPESVDQFGDIEGSSLQFSIDTRTDPRVFEETGCYTRPEQDRLADRELAIQAAQRMAAKQIRGSHRNNYAAFRYKPKTGRAGNRQLLPVEIGDTISVTSDEVTVTGWVSEFTHTTTGNGDRYTDIKLAVSRVDSAVQVTDNLAVPEVGTPRRVNRDALAAEPTVCGPTVEPEDEQPQVSDIALDGSITLVAPAIPADQTDELVGEASHTYTIAIPVNPFEVEVP